MPSVKPVAGGFRAQVKKLGVRDSRMFDSRKEAQAWGVTREAEILAGKRDAARGKTLRDLFDRYSKALPPERRGARWERVRLAKIGRDKLGSVLLSELGPEHFAEWRDRMLYPQDDSKPLKAGSVRREMGVMTAALKKAVKEWRWLPTSPLREIERPAKPRPRHRRISPEERSAVLLALDYRADVPPVADTARVGAAFDFAIETGMRSGEICRLTAEDDCGRYIKVRSGKTNAAKRDVPLTPRAREIVDQLLELGLPTLFGLDDASRDALFREKGTARALIKDLTFHDTRHEAASQMSKRVPVQVLAKILGVVDLRTLQEVYYNPTGDELADHLDNGARLSA